jgi:hypothetical protein
VPGKETLQEQLRDVREQRIWDAIDELRRDLDDERAKVATLRKAFDDERVSSAKSLGSAAAGGGATAGLVEAVMWLLQHGT